MGNVKALILGEACMLLMMSFATITYAAPFYEVNRSLACTSECSGNITVEGFVEVDALGSIPPASIINWHLAFNSTNNADVLTPSNSTVEIFGEPGIMPHPQN